MPTTRGLYFTVKTPSPSEGCPSPCADWEMQLCTSSANLDKPAKNVSCSNISLCTSRFQSQHWIHAEGLPREANCHSHRCLSCSLSSTTGAYQTVCCFQGNRHSTSLDSLFHRHVQENNIKIFSVKQSYGARSAQAQTTEIKPLARRWGVW